MWHLYVPWGKHVSSACHQYLQSAHMQQFEAPQYTLRDLNRVFAKLLLLSPASHIPPSPLPLPPRQSC